MRIGTALVSLAAASSFPSSLPKYDVNVKNIPGIGSYFRYKEGDNVEVPVIIPKQGETTYLLRANNYRDMIRIKTAKEACYKRSHVSCDEEMKTEASVIFKINDDGLHWADLTESKVSEEQAKLDEKKVRIINGDLESGGLWWSVHGSLDGNITSYKHDQMSLIMMVKSCQVQASWINELDFNKYGWHKNGNKLEFTPTGFNENDLFAQCSFVSSPPSLVSFELGEAQFNTVSMRVPKEQHYGFLTQCSVEGINNEAKWKVDKCQGQDEYASQSSIFSSPNKMDYYYNINTDTHGVFHYFDKNDASTDLAPLTFECLIHNSADSIKVMGSNFISPEFINATESASAMSISTDLVQYKGKQGNNYIFEISKQNLDIDVFELRCVYKQKQNLLGYSRPAVISVYNGESTPDDEPQAEWSSSVETIGGSHFVREGIHQSVATCHQTGTGTPGKIQFVAGNYKYPYEPVKQQAISLDFTPDKSYMEAELVCKMHFNNHESHTEKSLGSIEVIHKPYDLSISYREGLVICKATSHKHDKLQAALKINRNYFVSLVDGQAQFDLSQQLTESQLKRFDSRGTSCIFKSEKFPEEIFESRVYSSTPSIDLEDFEQGFPWGIILMLAGIGAVLSMCIGWNKAPKQNKIENEKLLD